MAFTIHFLFHVLQASLFLLVRARDQSGFISVDCGLSESTSYSDETTGIVYASDTGFTEFGESTEISPTYKGNAERQFWNVRSFPEGIRNCYTLKPSLNIGSGYLIRASFMYGNYDNKNQSPTFDLYLGVDLWDTVKIEGVDTIKTMEILHTISSGYVHVCLVNTGNGVPFISVLELRPVGTEFYSINSGSFLKLHMHFDFSSATNKIQRYKDDIYDRLWFPGYADTWKPFINVSFTDDNFILKNHFALPTAVMSNAYSQKRGLGYVHILWENLNNKSSYFLYMHFAELENLQANETREFNIYINGGLWIKNPVSLSYLQADTIYSTSGSTTDEEGKFDIWLNNTDRATVPPLINAIELFTLKELSGKDTNQTDVEAILDIKSVYGLKRLNWQGDPCGPEDYQWDGLNCSYSAYNPSRIVYLNLSSSGLQGEITSSISNLMMLECLDLSNNNLTGAVPNFLAQLSSLKILNLQGNNFTGPIPDALVERSKQDLQLLISNHINPSSSTNHSSGSHTKKKSFVVPLVSSLGGLGLVAMITAAMIWGVKRRKVKTAVDFIGNMEEDGSFASKNQQFNYSEIEKITNNFERVIGEGGFGKVYYGNLNGIQVAVKMLSSSSAQGHRQFHAELRLLMRVHHKNLTTLVGYCNESPNNIGLIYEYMTLGNLKFHLSGSSPEVLSWKNRLRIAIDTAQGLEYLHNGCKPPIVHRDVKSTNILLNEKFQAKLSDFGLSKIFPLEVDKHVLNASGNVGITTSVAGTPGYLDPEYYVSNWLNEKSDVYSFGVVLLEIITSRPVLANTRERNNHISEWVSFKLANGDIDGIIDPRLEGVFDKNTAWKAIEIAMACVSRTLTNRPTMSRVTVELKECLATEITRTVDHNSSESKDLAEIISSSDIVGPLAR